MFRVTYKPIAAEEYEAAVTWYAERSKAAAQNFVIAIEEKIEQISQTPKRYKNLYKSYFEVGIRLYPYTIVYFIEEKEQNVVIVAIYHQKRNPKKKYRK